MNPTNVLPLFPDLKPLTVREYAELRSLRTEVSPKAVAYRWITFSFPDLIQKAVRDNKRLVVLTEGGVHFSFRQVWYGHEIIIEDPLILRGRSWNCFALEAFLINRFYQDHYSATRMLRDACGHEQERKGNVLLSVFAIHSEKDTQYTLHTKPNDMRAPHVSAAQCVQAIYAHVRAWDLPPRSLIA